MYNAFIEGSFWPHLAEELVPVGPDDCVLEVHDEAGTGADRLEADGDVLRLAAGGDLLLVVELDAPHLADNLKGDDHGLAGYVGEGADKDDRDVVVGFLASWRGGFILQSLRLSKIVIQ